MEDKEYIKGLVKKHKGKMNAAILLKWMVTGLSAGFVAALLILIISFMTPFYYALPIAICLMSAGLVTGLIIGITKKVNDRKAALDIDSFGFKERMVTAFESVDKDEEIYVIQRSDAVRRVKGKEKNLKVKLLPRPRLMVIFSLLFISVLVAIFLPSKTKTEAKRIHIAHKEAEKTIEDVEEMIEELEKTKEDLKDSLSKEEREKLDDMIESLEASKDELENADDMSQVDTGRDKLQFKYNDIKNKLNDMANVKQKIDDDPESAERMKEAAEKAAEKEQEQQNQQGQNG
ncbi:MAG: hypothetical protein K6C35_09890, partial [Eubacterium sp.]|nr:hypothetical protein [Eubacterium sp.]